MKAQAPEVLNFNIFGRFKINECFEGVKNILYFFFFCILGGEETTKLYYFGVICMFYDLFNVRV